MKEIRFRFNPVTNPRGYTKQEFLDAVNVACSVMKMAVGVCNNATFEFLLNAHEMIKHHPAYKGKAEKMFLKVFRAWRTYENNLLYASQNRFFHVDDMSEQVRKRYGDDITDSQYFGFWKGLGSLAYVETKPLIGSLANKFRLSLVHNGIEHAEPLGYGLAAAECLELCNETWEESIRQSVEVSAVPKDILVRLFRGFSLQGIADLWSRALCELAPEARNHKVSYFDEQNITLGVKQLQEKWSHPAFMFESASANVSDWREVFRSKGEYIAALTELNEVKECVMEEMKQMRQEQLLNKLDKEQKI